MNTKFIFLLIFALFLKRTISMRSYFANSGHKLSDPIEENGKEKRSSEENQYFDDIALSNIKKDLTDLDYRNGNVEPDVEEREIDPVKNIKKRESKVISDIQSFSDAEIELALSKLSEGELEVLEKVMENEVATPKVQKRGIEESDLGQFCDGYGCKNKNSDDFTGGNYKQIITYEQLPDVRPKTRKVFKRLSRFSPLTRDEILQARIDFLKDNYKRQSEIGKIEKRRRRIQRDVGKNVIRNPYFNSLIGPRSRSKRSVDNSLTSEHKVNPMDDPKSDEHIKLLEESFPNANPDSSLDLNEPHIRVKRA